METFAKRLASSGNFKFYCVHIYLLVCLILDGSIRDKAVKSARQWVVQNCTRLDKLEFNKLWKGLFYSTSSIYIVQ